MASGVHVMEKPIQLQHHQQQQQQQKSHETLKCPRCDSLNTKFCYYNNYSLSQPRHFCKACKRYWTRGGTLRDVPVGGSCRKNKRVKRPITTTVAATSSPVGHQRNPNPNNNNNNNLDPNPIPSSNNPLFYALLSQNPNFPRLIDTASRVSCVTESSVVSRYDVLQASSGLVFSNPGLGGSVMNNHGQNNPSLTFSSFNSSMYGGGSTSSSTCAPTMASLLASSLDQQQRCMGLANYDGVSIVKDLKMEGIVQKMMDWNGNNFLERNKNHDQMEGVVSSDPNSILWDAEGGDWLDPTNNNIGSSVPSLI